MVKEITSLDEFRDAVKASENCLIVIDFTAVWCGPCQRIKPLFEKLSSTLKDVLFYKVDVDDAADVAGECGIRSMPTFHFYKGGKKVHEFSGADAIALEKKIHELK